MHPFCHLNPCADQEVHQHWLDLGLTGFEVVPSNEHTLLRRQLYGPWDKSVLRGAVDVGAALQYAGHCKKSGGRNLSSILMVIERKINQTNGSNLAYHYMTQERKARLAGLHFPENLFI